MTNSLFSNQNSSLMLLIGSIFLVIACLQAFLSRKNPTKLILWGILHDLGIITLALSATINLVITAIILFILTQFICRTLSLLAINRLTKSINYIGNDLNSLQGAGSKDILGGVILVFGFLAVIGDSPFLLPESRSFIVEAILNTSSQYGLFSLILMAITSAIFFWLHLITIRHIALEEMTDTMISKISSIKNNIQKKLTFPEILFVVLLALIGIFRSPLAELVAEPFGTQLYIQDIHPSFWFLYLGAFVSALCFLFKLSFAPLIGIIASCASLFTVLGVPTNPLSHLFLIMITVIALIVCIYSYGYIHDGPKIWYWFFLLLTFSSLIGIVSAENSSVLYDYWELMTFSSYFLIIYERKHQTLDAGSKYFVICQVSSLLVLPALFMMDTFASFPQMIVSMNGTLQIGIILCLIGFGAKLGLVPLHSWLPDAHPAAPSSVSGPLSGVITKMGIFGLLSYIIINFGPDLNKPDGLFGLSWFGTGLVGIGLATLVYGECMAFIQEDIKRMLAWSTIGQIGEIVLILGLGTWLATTGALWHMVNHAVMKDLLFLGAGALILRVGSKNLSDLSGIARDMPITVTCMVIGLISIMGLPPFGAFYGKYLMIQAACEANQIWLGVIVFIASLVGACYYTRIIKTIVFETRKGTLEKAEEAPLSMRIAMIVLAIICLILGLFPQILMPIILPIASLCQAPNFGDINIINSIKITWPIFVIVPIFGCLIPLLFSKNPKSSAYSSCIVLLITTILVLLFGRYMDTLSFIFALIVPILGIINMLYAANYMDHSHSQWRFYCAFTCMCGGLIGMVQSSTLLQFFLFWEIMSSWTLYMAIAHEGTKNALREAFKYFLFNLTGAGFLFIGVCLLGPSVPFDITAIHEFKPEMSYIVALSGLILLAIGFVMKAAQLPFRIDWQMHPALAPTPVSGYISSVLLKSAIIALIKLFAILGSIFGFWQIIGPFDLINIRMIIMWIGAFTIIYAAIKALSTDNIKLIFIYSTVSQLGYMVLAVSSGGNLGIAGGLQHLFNHVFFKDLLFLVCGAVMFASHAETLKDLGGLGKKMPFTMFAYIIGGLSVVGVPPTSGFSSKWLIYHALMNNGEPFLALLSLIGSVLTLAYIAKFIHAAFLGQVSDHIDHINEAPLFMKISMGNLVCGTIITGIFPGLTLIPINLILREYNMVMLDVNISGIIAGPGALNATSIGIMTVIALFIGYKFVKTFLKIREVDIHTCGEPINIATKKIPPESIYCGGLTRVIHGFSVTDDGNIS